MKNVMRGLLLMLACSGASASEFYVATLGSDVPAAGTAGSPWRSIRYACQQTAADQGHVINVAAGTYVESDIIVIPSGVSVIGSGSSDTVVRVDHFFDMTLYPMTVTDVPDVSYDNYDEHFVIQVNGANQTIRGFALDGQSRQCHGGVFADSAASVVFDDLLIEDFVFAGLWIYTSSDTEVKNCQILQCGFYNNATDTDGLLFHANTNLYIHDNVIRYEGSRGSYGIKAYAKYWTHFAWWQWWDTNWNAYAHGMRIMNNTISVPEVAGWTIGGNNVPGIVIEFNGISMRDCEIAYNELNNVVSLIGYQNTYKAARVHHNNYDLGFQYRYALEANLHNVEFDHNYVYGGLYPIAQWEARGAYGNHDFHHNVFEAQQDGQPVFKYVLGPTGFRFHHNTVLDTRGFGVIFEAGEGLKDADIRNNIFASTSGDRGDVLGAGAIQGALSHNCFYDITAHGTDNAVGEPRLVASGEKPAPYSNCSRAVRRATAESRYSA